MSCNTIQIRVFEYLSTITWWEFIGLLSHFKMWKCSQRAFPSEVSRQHFIWVNKISTTIQEFALLILASLGPRRVIKLDISSRTVSSNVGVCVLQQLSQTGVLFITTDWWLYIPAKKEEKYNMKIVLLTWLRYFKQEELKVKIWSYETYE